MVGSSLVPAVWLAPLARSGGRLCLLSQRQQRQPLSQLPGPLEPVASRKMRASFMTVCMLF
jgi:hypothetical protein